jgi:hypothetical protein
MNALSAPRVAAARQDRAEFCALLPEKPGKYGMPHEVVSRVTRAAAPAFLAQRSINDGDELPAPLDASIGKLVRP